MALLGDKCFVLTPLVTFPRLLRPCSEGPALLVVSVDLRDSPEVCANKLN